MGSVNFQVLFNNKIDFEETIRSLIIQVSKENNNQVDTGSINNFINIRYSKELSNSKYLIGFELILDGSFSVEELNIFCEYLDGVKYCDFMIKFGDEYLFDLLKKYYEEIFDIEMQLREIFSYIFISTYETDCFSFLEFQRQKINPLYKGVKDNEIPKFLKNKYQNEFFYLTFSQYRRLKLPDIIKSETLINLLANNKTFDELEKNIQKLGVLNPKKNEFLEFLNRISENLESVETIRNCVAHNREPTDDEMGNYEMAKSKLEKIVSDFFTDLKSVCPNCGGAIKETQKTIYQGHEEDQEPIAIYHRVGCLECNYTLHEDTIDI
ncbi:MAG: hypothetical protein WC501_05485 [Candidatus Micrarchaeia archaeon]|jgi:ribosomal protein S27AE